MIKPLLEDIHSKIKARSKEEWISVLTQKIRDLRAYIQDNGEIGFVAAFVLGIFVVVFFKLAFAIFFLMALAGAMVWCLAESDIERRSTGITRLEPTEVKDIQLDNDDTSIQ